MQCFVYRSLRRENTYLFLAKKDSFDVIPEPLLRVFGDPEFSFEFELNKDKNLVRENSMDVIKNIQERGFHLQMPAENKELLERQFSQI